MTYLEGKILTLTVCSFRFPRLSGTNIAYRQSCLLYVHYDGHVAYDLRGTITGASSAMCKEMIPENHPCHPLTPIIQGFLHIDDHHNRPDLERCIERIQQFETKLKDSTKDSPVAGRSLNYLNTKLSELRTRLHYMDASIDTMVEGFTNEPFSRVVFGSTPDAEGEAMSIPTRHSDNWYHLSNSVNEIYGISRSGNPLVKASELKNACRQRLLVVDGLQQRLNISLSVVRPLDTHALSPAYS